MKIEKKINVLCIPAWYPNENDSQNGSFIKAHNLAISKYCCVTVLHTDYMPENRINEKYFVNKIENDSINTVHSYYKQSKISKFGKIINGYRKWKSFHKAYKFISTNNSFDIVHLHVISWLSILFILFFARKTPYIVSEHWSGYISGAFSKKTWLEKYFYHRIIKNAGAFTVISEVLKSKVIDLKLVNENLRVIPNIIYAPKIIINKKREKELLIILSIADLNDCIKNISSVINVVSRVLKTHHDFEYHIIGGGYDEERLIQQAKDLDLFNKKIFFLGKQSQDFVLQYLSNAAFLVVNSNVETFSMVSAEAILQNIPVIATKCGGPEYLLTTDSGLLIEKNNDKALENAIIYMLNNYKSFSCIEAKQHIIDNFSEEIIGADFFRIYMHVLINKTF